MSAWKPCTKNKLAQKYLESEKGVRWEIEHLAQRIDHPDSTELRRFLNCQALKLENGTARGPRLGREFSVIPKTGKGEVLVAVTFIASAAQAELADSNFTRNERKKHHWARRIRAQRLQLPKLIGRQLKAAQGELT